MKPFSELVVVEVAGSVAGAYAGKLFSDLGARVVKVEPPAGDPTRWTGPLGGGGVSTTFQYLNTGKSSLAVDLGTRSGEAIFQRLCAAADVIIESFSPGPAAPLADHLTSHDQATRVRISPFGLTGPSASWKSTPFTDFAVSGHMYLTGEPDREPLQGAPMQTLYAAGTHGFIGALAALHARSGLGHGQDIDVSHFEVMASLHQWTSVRYTHGGIIQRRVGNRYGSLHPSTIYQCKDGYVAFGAVGNEPLERFLAVVGMAELLQEPRFASGAERFANADAFDAILGPWMLGHTVSEVVELGQAVRAPVAPVNTIADLLGGAHLNERGFWMVPEGGNESARYPGPPFRMSGHEWRLRPAPEVGQGSAPWVDEVDAGQHLRRAAIVRDDPDA